MSDDSWATASAILQYIRFQTPYDGSWHIKAKGIDGVWVVLLVLPTAAAAAEEVARLARTSLCDMEYLLVQASQERDPASQAGRLAFRGLRRHRDHELSRPA